MAMTEVRIVDATEGRWHAESLAAAVQRRGLPAAVGDEHDLTRACGGLMLVLPAVLDARPRAPEAVLYRIGRLAASPTRRDRTTPGLVVVWSVRHADRAVLATPHDGLEYSRAGQRRGGWNETALLLGGTWARERFRHGGEAAATRCLSDRIERLFCAGSHQDLAGTDATALRAALRALDPSVLHTVCVEISENRDGPDARWAGRDAAAAAMAVRIAASADGRAL
jgi:hypothetical protein